MTSRLCAVVLLTLPVAALAEEPQPAGEVSAAVTEPPRTWLDLRVGATTTEGIAQLCAAAYPLEMLAVEGCGNGSGFLHRQPAPEIAHFRGKARLFQQALGPVFVEPWLGLGFAELQVAPDAPGFDFGGTGPSGVETAGAEVGGSLRAVWPLLWGFELVGGVDASLAYFPEAPRLVRPMEPWQPTLSADVGIGW